MSASFGFEKLQGSFPFSIVSGASSFSPEDLVSNLISFCSAFMSIPQSRMRRICGEVSVEESYRVVVIFEVIPSQQSAIIRYYIGV